MCEMLLFPLFVATRFMQALQYYYYSRAYSIPVYNRKGPSSHC